MPDDDLEKAIDDAFARKQRTIEELLSVPPGTPLNAFDAYLQERDRQKRELKAAILAELEKDSPPDNRTYQNEE